MWCVDRCLHCVLEDIVENFCRCMRVMEWCVLLASGGVEGDVDMWLKDGVVVVGDG